MSHPSDNLPDDQFRYSCYALVIPIPDNLRAQMNEIERQAGQERAKIPAHITVKGTFHGIESLDGVMDTVRAVTGKTSPVFITFNGAETHWSDSSGFLNLPIPPELQALHDALVAEVSPLGETVYTDDPYRAHMTIIQEVTPEGLNTARRMFEEIEFDEGFLADSVELMARSGPAYGGQWHMIQRFPLEGHVLSR